jgi:EAL domain-containing protein (putative c-di-GMP-specific phosphodiesterase class I)/DNA-binding response OmpR family regulator
LTTLHLDPPPTVNDAERPSDGAARRSVLVVDDDAMLRRLIGLALREEGFDVAEAADGQSALRMVAEAATTRPFSLMLLDGQMPVLSGRQVLQQLRADPATATLPVILVTADTALVDRLSGLAAGADDYLTKPFSLEEIVARVRAHLRAHDAWADTLAAHTRQRTLLARALQAASRQPSLEGAAGVLCNALASQDDVRAAVVARFTADGQAVPVACAGAPLWGLRAGDPMPPALRRYLNARAAAGPWLERGEATAGVERPPALIAGPRVACAPFGEEDRGGLHGVLLLELGDGRGAGAGAVGASAALAGAIDFAAVVEGLLRPRLVEQRRTELERMELRAVLRERAFRPHFQPIVDLTTGRIVGAEALTRFDDGSNPETRFREAALLGLGPDLELATLAAAVREAGALLPPSAWISLNVSPALMLSSHGSTVRSILDLRDGSREVVLELSEQEAVNDYDSLRSAVQSVGDGIRLSVDDAGSGFASLRHILRLEPDFIKLDRSWVHGVDTDPARQAMIAGLRHFADQTGAQLIAEGIERDEERAALITLDVDLGQGYLLGRPAPVEAGASAG